MDMNFDKEFFVMFENNSTSNYLLLRPRTKIYWLIIRYRCFSIIKLGVYWILT